MTTSARRRISTVLALTALLGACGGGDGGGAEATSPPTAATEADHRLAACAGPDRPPFSTLAGDGTLTGLEPDLLALVADELGVKLELSELDPSAPVPETCEVLANGYGYNGEPPEGGSRLFPDDYAHSVPWLATDPHVGVTTTGATTLDDLAAGGATIAVPNTGGSLFGAISAVPGLVVQDGLPTDSDLADDATIDAALASGEVDAVALGWIFGVALAATYGYGLVDLAELPDTEGPRSWTLAPRADLAEDIDAALTSLAEKGAIAALLDERYGGVPGWIPPGGPTAAGTAGDGPDSPDSPDSPDGEAAASAPLAPLVGPDDVPSGYGDSDPVPLATVLASGTCLTDDIEVVDESSHSFFQDDGVHGLLVTSGTAELAIPGEEVGAALAAGTPCDRTEDEWQIHVEPATQGEGTVELVVQKAQLGYEEDGFTEHLLVMWSGNRVGWLRARPDTYTSLRDTALSRFQQVERE